MVKCPIGIFSKIPFETRDHKEEEEFWHIFKEFYFPSHDMSIFLTHLVPWEYHKRIKEAKILADVIKRCKSKHIILTGDLNTLSPLDNETYSKEHEGIRKADIERQKFVDENGHINYEASEIFSSFLTDAYHTQPNRSPDFCYTVPTKKNQDNAHFTRLRLDYFYVNSETAPLVNECKPIYIGTDYISDHYPVCLMLDL